ncbi:MAG: hypothetical protein HZA52_15430 [Planctomycetes bacterium]|nr:hypothetical protein [Planctomycetota bacterium]
MSAPARVRALAEARVDVGGEWFVGLTDLLGVAPSDARFAALLRPDEWRVARLFDGESDAAVIAERASRELGLASDDSDANRAFGDSGASGDAGAPGDMGAAAIDALATRLSDSLLLDDAPSRAALERAWSEYRALAERPALGPGRDYPADAFELRLLIGGMVADDWDLPPPESCVGAWTCEAGLRVARALHARTWAALRHFAGRFQRVLVLAPLRANFAAPWIALDKPLATPLGAVAADPELVGVFGAPADETGLAARSSLVLERQALFLRVLMRDKPAAFVLARPPCDARESARLDEHLARALAVPDTLLVVAADLAREHLALPGPDVVPRTDRSPTRLGGSTGAERDQLLVTHADVDRARADDRDAVDALTRIDGARLDALRVAEPSAYRAASLALLASVSRTFASAHPDSRGSLLGYAQASERGTLIAGASVLIH